MEIKYRKAMKRKLTDKASYREHGKGGPEELWTEGGKLEKLFKDLIDKEFVEKWCYGYEQLKEHVKMYTPEWGEKITGIPADQIIETSILYATTKEALIDVGNGVEHSPSSSDAVRAIAILMAITGHLDRPGCNIFKKQSLTVTFSVCFTFLPL